MSGDAKRIEDVEVDVQTRFRCPECGELTHAQEWNDRWVDAQTVTLEEGARQRASVCLGDCPACGETARVL